MNIKRTIYFFIGGIVIIFFSITAILQFYFKDSSLMASGTISNLSENTNLIEKIYLDWWDVSLDKVSSQGARDIYEVKNTYNSLNILVKETNVLRDVILREIFVDDKPLSYYEPEIVESDGKTVFKILLSKISNNGTNKLTKLITIFNRYDNVFYNVEIDSFQFRFSFSKDLNFLYFNFDNYISNFYDGEFKIESTFSVNNSEERTYNFGHINQSVSIPISNDLDSHITKDNRETLFRENTKIIIYNRFSIPIMVIEVLNSGNLNIVESYSVSNIYDIEFKNQVFIFESNEDNIFKISRNEDGSFDLENLIDNYGIYFNENLMSTYKLYGNERDDKDLINFKIYRDLRDGSYIFSPNKAISLYKFYNIDENKFLSYDKSGNNFVFRDNGSKFILTKDNKLFDIENRVFLKRDTKANKNYYIGDKNLENGEIFKFNNMLSSIFKKVSYDDIEKEILSGNYIQVLLKNKYTGEFLSVNSNSNEAINSTLHNDYYLDNNFNYETGTNIFSNFLFEIRQYNGDLMSFNLYSKVKETSLTADYGFLNNKLIFDKSNNNKIRFTLEKNDSRDNEFKIKDEYNSSLSFVESDNFARVTSTGFWKNLFDVDGKVNELDVFEIYMLDFDIIEKINSWDYVSLSSRKNSESVFLDKITSDGSVDNLKNIDGYVVVKNKEIVFLDEDSLLKDMIAVTDYKSLKGIDYPLLSMKKEKNLGYKFKILNDLNNTRDIEIGTIE